MTKPLLDESLPRRLVQLFPESFEVATVQNQGWSGIKNGALLKAAADHGFVALITADKNIEYQQNQNTLPCAIIVLDTRTNRYEDLAPLIPDVIRVFDNEVMGVVRVAPNE